MILQSDVSIVSPVISRRVPDERKRLILVGNSGSKMFSVLCMLNLLCCNYNGFDGILDKARIITSYFSISVNYNQHKAAREN